MSLAEAFYGDDSRLQHHTALVHTAAEHVRAALRVANPLEAPLAAAYNQHNPGEDEFLFRWLGIAEPTPSALPGGDDVPGQDEEANDKTDEDAWTELPFANSEIEEAVPEVIPAPSSLWTPWPRGRLAPSRPNYRGRRAAPDPATRVVSAVETFGSFPIQREVQLWVAGTDARQEQLRKLMVSVLITKLSQLSAHSNLVRSCFPRRSSRSSLQSSRLRIPPNRRSRNATSPKPGLRCGVGACASTPLPRLGSMSTLVRKRRCAPRHGGWYSSRVTRSRYTH